MAMRIGIIGAGAIGSVVGGMLTKAGHDVTLIDQWPEHVETMRKNGLRLSGTCGDHVIPVKALHIYEAQAISEPFDAVFISVKSYDTERARELARIMSDVAVAKVTTNLFGERWSKLTVNCMANPIAGLSGLGTAEVRTRPEPRLIAIYVGGEVVKVGRVCGFEVEPI